IKDTGVFDTSHVPAEPDARSVEITNATPTIYSLAKKYGTTVDAVLKVNPHIDPTKLKIGQVIRLP
ncbi:LysM peptidoglycan-binding domain-containing protein, partial [Escherichia coli]